MNATLLTKVSANYTLFEIQTPSGTAVREYVSSSGMVFAVAWEGPSLPDLRQLLGGFFAQYVQAANTGGTGTRVIEQPGLVVYAGGHMRAFRGRALATDLIPAAFGLEEIR